LDASRTIFGFIAHPFRTARVVFALCWYSRLLLRQGDRCVKYLDDLEEFVTGARVSWWRRRANQVWVPIADYCHLWVRITRFTQADELEHRSRVVKAQKRVDEIARNLTAGRSFLRTREARQVQASYIGVAFWDLLRIQVNEREAQAMSFFAESSEAIRDFLDCCQAVAALDRRAEMSAALPSFAALLEPCRYKRMKNDKDGPQPGELAQAFLTNGANPPRQGRLQRTVTPPEAFWIAHEAPPDFAWESLPAWVSEPFEEEHTDWIQKIPRTLRGALALALGYRWLRRLLERIEPLLDVAALRHGSEFRPKDKWRIAIHRIRNNALAAAGV
jgi:hypothetical protein